MRATDFITEVFEPGKDWSWAFRGSEEAFAEFKVGADEYMWYARNNPRDVTRWEIEFKKRGSKNDREKAFGMSGSENSTEVMSTIVDITRNFLEYYGDKVLEIRFESQGDSRTSLYARMVTRLLPNWDMHSRNRDGNTEFYLTNPKAYEQLDELYDPETSFELKYDDSFGPKELHARAYDRQGNYIDINFVPVRDNITDIEFSRNDSFDVTGGGDASRVFATVIEATKRYLQNYRPPAIVFSGKSGSRSKLYQRLVDRFAKEFGYRQVDLTRYSQQAQQQIAGSGSSAFVLKDTHPRIKEDISRRGFLGALGGVAATAAGLDAEAKPNVIKPKTKVPSQQLIQQAKKQQTSRPATPSKDPQAEGMLYRTAKASGMKGIELAQFLAQTKHESWDHSRLQEKPVGDPNKYFAKKYDPTLAPKTAKILGNKLRGDGVKYHGRGFIQLTGRDNYRMASEALGLDLLNRPDLASKPDVAAKIAVWYWNTRVKPKVQNFDDTVAVTKTINNAMFGLEDRLANFIDYKKRVA